MSTRKGRPTLSSFRALAPTEHGDTWDSNVGRPPSLDRLGKAELEGEVLIDPHADAPGAHGCPAHSAIGAPRVGNAGAAATAAPIGSIC
ncbi:hypothetical protein MLAC_19980 [Mycobacterium lacus]|uniref:Uncharacterized protein n=1 Tax=Mycobacterium lacus TaxID=169765 RepID=A0A7I7NJF3_9MYCO|nr:hypothetical protein MLAC_19980 [Mycobacterium lacus]